MAFELSITILVVFLALHKCLVCKNELPPSSFTNIYSTEVKFKESSLEINQPNTAHIFAYSRLLSRNRHGRAPAPVLRTNSMGRITQLLLMIACDCSSMNPGPAKHRCGVCEQPCKSNQKAIQCDECLYWFHTKCISMTAQSYDRLGSDSKLAWLCTKCIFPNFSTTFLLGEMDASHENTFDSLSSEESTTESLLGPPLFTSSPSNPPARPRPRNQDLRRKLKVLSLNCNGIKSRKKKSEFHSLIVLHDPDIIFGCESKINPSVPTYSVFPDNYEIFRKDRCLYGGGVFIAARKDLAVMEERGLDVDDCEIITCTLQLVKRKKLFLTSFYRPPSTDQDALNLLDDHLCKLYSKNIQFPNVIMGGDFNCSGIDWSTGEPALVSSAHSWDRTLIDLADKFGFSQHVKAPTRKNNYLDLVFSSNPGLIQACHVTSGLSDHERAALFEIDTSPKYTPKAPRKIYQYHKADFEGLRSHLSTFGADYTSWPPHCRISSLVAINIFQED